MGSEHCRTQAEKMAECDGSGNLVVVNPRLTEPSAERH